MWYNRDINKFRKLSKDLSEASSKLKREEFTFEEQELIRRVIKSVYPQIQSIKDRTLANSILDKTKRFGEDDI